MGRSRLEKCRLSRRGSSWEGKRVGMEWKTHPPQRSQAGGPQTLFVPQIYFVFLAYNFLSFFSQLLMLKNEAISHEMQISKLF